MGDLLLLSISFQDIAFSLSPAPLRLALPLQTNTPRLSRPIRRWSSHPPSLLLLLLLLSLLHQTLLLLLSLLHQMRLLSLLLKLLMLLLTVHSPLLRLSLQRPRRLRLPRLRLHLRLGRPLHLRLLLLLHSLRLHQRRLLIRPSPRGTQSRARRDIERPINRMRNRLNFRPELLLNLVQIEPILIRDQINRKAQVAKPA